MLRKITKKVPEGRILFEYKQSGFYYHATKGWKLRSATQEQLTNGYNKIIEFLMKGK